jgi:hypothetical protein
MALACESLEARIRRFPRSYRRRLRKLVRGSRPLSDLLYSFPGAAFVLAAGNRSPDARGLAIRLVKSGASLAAVAEALDLPLWLRRLPPEAFAAPFGPLPAEAGFARQIVNLIPRTPETTPMWLQWVAFGAEAGDGALALWLADKRIYKAGEVGSIPLLPLIAFAWFSVNRNTVAHRLIDGPWHRKMRFKGAVAEARIWLERVIVDYCLEQQAGNGGWYKEARASGYRFVPLRTPQELSEEGDRMKNCVATYAGKVATGACLIYSVRRGGKRVATLEVTPKLRSQEARVTQLRGPENCDPAEDVVRAAEGWLAKRGRYPVVARDSLGYLPIRSDRWEEIWQPFCSEKPQFGEYFLRSREQALAGLFRDLRRLEAWQEAQ